MVKSKFGFSQMQAKSSSGYSVELLQPAFSITPERFNAIDMVLAPSKLIGTAIHSKVFIKIYVYQSIIATHQILRCRTRQASGGSNPQLRLTSSDHHSALSLSLTGWAVLQMDKTTCSDQAVLRHHRERSQDTNMDSHHDLRFGRHRQKPPQYQWFALYDPTDFKPDSFWENAAWSFT